LAGGLAAIISLTVTRPPFSVMATVLGVVALAVLLLYLVWGGRSPMANLGIGGEERWVAYPVTVWLMGLGGYLMDRAR
jgi:hypothetical protein